MNGNSIGNVSYMVYKYTFSCVRHYSIDLNVGAMQIRIINMQIMAAIDMKNIIMLISLLLCMTNVTQMVSRHTFSWSMNEIRSLTIALDKGKNVMNVLE